VEQNLTPGQALTFFNREAGWRVSADSPETEIWCLHCGRSFRVKDVRKVCYGRDGWFAECPNECDGSPMDWARFPWWDPDVPDPRFASSDAS